MIHIAHVFYEVNICLGHLRLAELMEKEAKAKLKDGEVAIFINRHFTNCKILAPGMALIHHKDTDGLTVRGILDLPKRFGGPAFALSKTLLQQIHKAIAEAPQHKAA